MIHPLSSVETKKIGKGTFIWQYSVVLGGAEIGDNCNINCHTFIENDVVIGDNVTIKAGVYLWDGITIEDDVFIGPNATFVNDRSPRSKQYPNQFDKTRIKRSASIGANATILGGVVVGTLSMIGAGAVVTKDVPNNAVLVGNPAKIIGWVDEKGKKLRSLGGNKWISEAGTVYLAGENSIVKV